MENKGGEKMETSFDNRLFNINGRTDDLLKSILPIAFRQAGFETAEGWRITKEKGLILYWHISENSKGARMYKGN